MLPENQGGFTAKPQVSKRRRPAGQWESPVSLGMAAGSYNQDYLTHRGHASNGITLYQPNGTMGLQKEQHRQKDAFMLANPS